MVYMLNGKKYKHLRHINHLRPRYTENVIEEQEIPTEVLDNMFDMPAPLIPIIERRTSKRKRKRVKPFSPIRTKEFHSLPKRKRY